MHVEEEKKPVAQVEETKEKPGVKVPRKGKLIKRGGKPKKEIRRETQKDEAKSKTEEEKGSGFFLILLGKVEEEEGEEWEDEDSPAVKLTELLSDLTLNDGPVVDSSGKMPVSVPIPPPPVFKQTVHEKQGSA